MKPQGRETAIPGMEHLSPASSLEPETIWTFSCWPYAVLHELVACPERFAQPREEGQRHPYATHSGGGKTLVAKLRYDVGDGEEPEDADKERLAELRDNLGGWTADALDVVASACIGAGGSAVEVSTHTLLSARGLSKNLLQNGSRGGYAPAQLDQARLALSQVASLHLLYREKRKAKEPLVLGDPAFIFERIPRKGHGALDVFRVRPGAVLRHFLDEAPSGVGSGAKSNATRKQIIQLDTRVLSLDPTKERVAKRVARYAYYLTRMSNPSDPAPGVPPTRVTLKVKTLLEHAGLPLDPHDPKRTRESLERALNKVAAEEGYRVGIVAAWRYDGAEPPTTGKWTKGWLDSLVLITPPEHVVLRVREVAARRALHTQERKFGVIDGGKNAPVTAASDSQATLGARLRACRTAASLTQGRVAADLGLKQSTISRIESGKLTPDEGHERGIEGWLSLRDEAPAESSA